MCPRCLSMPLSSCFNPKYDRSLHATPSACASLSTFTRSTPFIVPSSYAVPPALSVIQGISSLLLRPRAHRFLLTLPTPFPRSFFARSWLRHLLSVWPRAVLLNRFRFVRALPSWLLCRHHLQHLQALPCWGLCADRWQLSVHPVPHR